MKNTPPGRHPRFPAAFVAGRFKVALALLASGAVLLGIVPDVCAQNFILKPIHGFAPLTSQGVNPSSALVRDRNGNLYGTTAGGGGVSNSGTVFQIAPDGTFSVLHAFSLPDENGQNSDGANPLGGIILATDGAFYGTAANGGQSGTGTIFKITPNGNFPLFDNLRSFTSLDNGTGNPGNFDGAYPLAALCQGRDGNFYGMASEGGTNDLGTIFEITPDGTFTSHFSFDSTKGASPRSALIEVDGYFYGTTSAGGGSASAGEPGGTVFYIDLSLPDPPYYDFHYDHGFSPDDPLGTTPLGALVMDLNLVGTTSTGGAAGNGAFFRGGYMESRVVLLHAFAAGEGSNAQGPLLTGNDGNFYGTLADSNGGSGTIYQMTGAGDFTALYRFSAEDPTSKNLDGGHPTGGVIEDPDGNFYGTTSTGGSNGGGTVFTLTSDLTYSVLHDFIVPNLDGAGSVAGLIEGSDGNFYGTTYKGGAHGNGTIFKLTSDGTVTTLHDFTFAGDGGGPQGSLVQGSGGNFFGTTSSGGTGAGTVFRLTADGTFSTLHSFVHSDGEYPRNGLVAGTDGSFYGTTASGGMSPQVPVTTAGTVFRITRAGALTTIYNFSPAGSETTPINGANPSSLTLGADGNFYGTTYKGGNLAYPDPEGDGTVFRITPQGTLTTLYTFSTTSYAGLGVAPINSDGANPFAGLILGTDGNFYGTTMNGGVHGAGTIFKITAAGTLTTLYSFSAVGLDSTNSDGANPTAALVQAMDGNFYGVARNGGTNGSGTFFRLTPAGAMTVLDSFSPQDTDGSNDEGAQASAALLQARNGILYGITSSGGPGGTGSILQITFPPVITSAAAATGIVGQPFSYQIAATGSPTSYGVQGLPAGLGVNATTGVVSGVPKATGTFTLTLNAFNDAGKGSGTLTLKVAPAAPVITSAGTATATAGVAFHYQITATGSPTSYGVQGLPAGLTVNARTGVISGAPKITGTFTLTLNAYNATGKGSAALTLTVKLGPPAVTSATTASGTTGKAFSYQITATNSPTSYGVQGLPGGLSVNSTSGLISGTPKVAGTSTLTLNAYNSVGKGSGTLTLTITN